MNYLKTHIPLIVLAAALLTRLIYFFQYYGTPFYLVPMWDAGEYHDMAVALSKGSLHPAFAYRPPLYPLLLGLIYIVFGAGSFFPSLLQLAGGVYICILVQRIATRLFGAWAGLGAGLAAALSGMMVFYDLELMPTSLEALLLLLLLNELTKFVDNKVVGKWVSGQVDKPESGQVTSGQVGELTSWRVGEFERGGGLPGVWFALGVLAKPVLLPLLPVILIWGWRVKVRWQTLAVFAGTGLSSLVFMMLFSLAAGNGAMMTPAQGGVNFYIGNRQGADGFTATLPNVGSGWSWETVSKLAEESEGRLLTPKDVDRHYWKAGFREISADPAGWVKLKIRKTGLFWNHLEISNDRDIYYHAHRYSIIGWLLWIGTPLFFPFALAGIILFFYDRRILLIYLLILFYQEVVALFFVNGRFRHPLTPLLIILAVGSVKWIIDAVRSRTFRWDWSTSGAVAGFVVGVFSLYVVDTGIDSKRWDYGYFTEATAMMELERFDEAEKLFLKALEVNPRAPFVNFNLGDLERQRGRITTAAEYYQRETTIQPHYGKAWNNLGLMLMAAGDPDRAVECFEEAIRVRPDLTEAITNAINAWQRRAGSAKESGDKISVRRAEERIAELRGMASFRPR